jgi:hypothetical protein
MKEELDPVALETATRFHDALIELSYWLEAQGLLKAAKP